MPAHYQVTPRDMKPGDEVANETTQGRRQPRRWTQASAVRVGAGAAFTRFTRCRSSVYSPAPQLSHPLPTASNLAEREDPGRTSSPPLRLPDPGILDQQPQGVGPALRRALRAVQARWPTCSVRWRGGGRGPIQGRARKVPRSRVRTSPLRRGFRITRCDFRRITDRLLRANRPRTAGLLRMMLIPRSS